MARSCAAAADGLDGRQEDGVLDEVGVTAHHADVGADGGQPARAAVQLGRVADRAVFLPVGQVGAVDQPLQHVLAVLLGAGGAEDHLVPFGQEVRVGSAVRAELDGQGVRVLGQGLLADVHVAEVAVFEQVDRVEQFARARPGSGTRRSVPTAGGTARSAPRSP